MKKLFPRIYARLFPSYSKWKLLCINQFDLEVRAIQVRYNISTGEIQFKATKIITPVYSNLTQRDDGSITKEGILNAIYESFE